MENNKQIKNLFEIIENESDKFTYSIFRSFLYLNEVQPSIDKNNNNFVKNYVKNLHKYFCILKDIKFDNYVNYTVIGLEMFKSSPELRNLLKGDISDVSIDNILNFLKKLPHNYFYVDYQDYLYSDNCNYDFYIECYSLLDDLKMIIYNDDYKYGDFILNLFEEIELDKFFLGFDRYKKVSSDNFYLHNFINYLNLFLNCLDEFLGRSEIFMYQFTIQHLFNCKKKLHKFLMSKEIIQYGFLKNYIEHDFIDYFKRGFLKTKKKYFITVGPNSNFNLGSFRLSNRNETLNEIQKFCSKLSDLTILDLYDLSIVPYNKITNKDIIKIDRIAEDIACAYTNSQVISNEFSNSECNLINQYFNKLVDKAVDFNLDVLNYLSIMNNDYSKNSTISIMISNFIFYVSIKKNKDALFACVKFAKRNVFRDRIFFANDSLRILKFIQDYEYNLSNNSRF